MTTTPTQPQPGPRDPRSGGRPVRRVLTTAAVCGLAVGAVATVSWATRSDAADGTTVTENISTLELDVRSGAVEVIGTDGDHVEIEWRERAGFLADATVTHQVTGSTLRVVGDCDRDWWISQCSTDVVVRVPADVDVVAVSQAGQVTVAGIDGTTEARSNAGRVRVEDQAGDLVAHSDAGAVTVDGLAARTATVTSNAGTVTVDAAEPAESIVAESQAGAVRITVPDDGAPYAVEANSDAGSTTVDVATDPSADRTILAGSNAGEVVVTGR